METRPARWIARLVGMAPAAVLSLFAPVALAQGPDVQLAPSTAIDCLTPAAAQRGQPAYPEALLEHHEGARVLVELVFDHADRAPEVKVLERTGRDAFVTAIEAHVASFRIPCAAGDTLPVRLQQEYVFQPEKRKVSWTTPTDLADAVRRRVLKCMAANDGSKTPEYPAFARRYGAQGMVLAKLRFTGPDLPPEVTVHAASHVTRQMAKEAVLPWVAKLRLPCIEGAAVESIVAFKFLMQDGAPFGFRNTDFVSFLRMAKNAEQPGARFDTQEMGCPFEVRLVYRQPFFPNRVGEVDAVQASRRPLLEWLSTLVLDLGLAQQDAVLGDSVNLTVPCANIDFNPKEKSS